MKTFRIYAIIIGSIGFIIALHNACLIGQSEIFIENSALTLAGSVFWLAYATYYQTDR